MTRYDPVPLAIPVENWAWRKSPRSSIGSRSRRSCQTNSAARTTAVPNSPTINADPQPRSAPNVMAESNAATAGKNMASPDQSNRTRAKRFWLLGTSRIAATAPKRPKGTLTKKMRRHPPAAKSSPPTEGPRASPSAWAVPWSPMAFPSDRLGTTSTMMARLLACNIAAPTAWRARKPHSAARDGANPQSTEAKVKMRKP